jgi:hypothetical protein
MALLSILRYPDARLILAHAGICDLAWIWRVAPDHPNLLFDTAWWIPADLEALFSLVPPGQIVFASDAPYGNTFISGSAHGCFMSWRPCRLRPSIPAAPISSASAHGARTRCLIF